jgi:UDP-N-acetylglucosamine diphosphorylase/glucosamine-1-phosphate N-acetyltransferase
MRLCLVEDHAASDLEPLTLTRPVFDLLLGADSIGCKIVRAFRLRSGSAQFGAVVRPHLEDVKRLRNPHIAINDRDWLAQGPTLVANGRWVPPAEFMPPASVPPWVGTCDGLPACALVGPERSAGLEPGGVDEWFEAVAARARTHEVGGDWIRRPWDLVAGNAAQLDRDFVEAAGRVGPTTHRLESVALIGPPGRLAIHESARIEPYTVLDTSHGPITIAAGAIVQSFTRIEGPCYVGPSTQLFRANLRGGVTLGPDCRIGGEVEEAIIHGHTNKYHEGFLGHSYVGEWVNLGAMTSSSDLRNDYGEVHVPLGGDPVATGLAKVGCFLGDFTRTGMGCMLNTGTVAGVMCNLLPAGRLLPKHVPSFTAVRFGRVSPNVPLDRLFITARIVAARRGEVFSAVEELLFSDLYEQTRLERERALLEAADGHADHRPIMIAGVGV